MPGSDFPVAGIGASAGGLAAFKEFFSGFQSLPDPGMAFVLVQHLAPEHKSMLADLVRKFTLLQVFEVEDGMQISKNCVYVIPPSHEMALQQGVFRLFPLSDSPGPRLAIDGFLASLAENSGPLAAGIILSGTGSDGSQGLKDIRAAGGILLVQAPESAEHDSMPKAALALNQVDHILAPAAMAGALMSFSAKVLQGTVTRQHPAHARGETSIRKIHLILKSRTGHDFSHYKQNTIKRRMERRMAGNQIDRMEDYVRFLESNPAEVEALFQDLLIGVTSFFRDPEAWATLMAHILADLMGSKPDGATLRVWSCGCSTGEEAYSLAILLQEAMSCSGKNFRFQIFATDMDDRGIEQARSGRYPATIRDDVSSERLARFFNPAEEGHSWRVNKSLRDMLIFSSHDIVKDPPFSRLDLVVCRNLMIYLDTELQKRLIPLFHYALNQGGMLFLGNSESIGEHPNLFSSLDRHAKIFLRKDDAALYHYSSSRVFSFPRIPVIPNSSPPDLRTGYPDPGLKGITEHLLLDRHAPVSLLVNQKGEILYVHGNTGPFLELGTGEPGLNILKLARPGILQDLTSALHKAGRQGVEVSCPGLRVKDTGTGLTMDLTVLPVSPPAGTPTSETEKLFLVSFVTPAKDQAVPPPILTALAPGAGLHESVAETIRRLREELIHKEEYLRSANEELETSNEELKSSNEEMQSINEELQSANEELETSKEELQSVNEELSTVNAELQSKVLDLTRINNDMNNLLAGTGVGTIFVDFQLCIQRFTPSVVQVINLIPGDVGRPLGHIVSNLVGYDSLVKDIREVLDTLVHKEMEVLTTEGHRFLLRIRPYRTLENVIEGAVITFFDITEIKKALESR